MKVWYTSLCHWLLTTIAFTLQLWKKCRQTHSLTSPVSFMINVLYNAEILDSLSTVQMLTWAQAKIFKLWHVINLITCKLYFFADLRSKKNLPAHLHYSYLQLRHYFLPKQPSLRLDCLWNSNTSVYKGLPKLSWFLPCTNFYISFLETNWTSSI